MYLKEIIKRLRALESADRDLDVQIALEMGYQMREEDIADTNGNPTKRKLWLIPSGENAERVPSYTSSLEHAYRLALLIAPGDPIAVVSIDGRGKAQLEGDECFEGANPAIALCLAVLKRRIVIKGRKDAPVND